MHADEIVSSQKKNYIILSQLIMSQNTKRIILAFFETFFSKYSKRNAFLVYVKSVAF